MRIAYFCNTYPTEVRPAFEKEMLELLSRGHEIFLFPLWGQTSDDSRIPLEIRSRVYRPPSLFTHHMFYTFFSLLREPTRFLTFLQISRRFIGLQFSLASFPVALQLKKLRVDRIHAHFASNAALRGMVLAKFLNIPFSCTGHGSELLLYPDPHLSDIIHASQPFMTISEYNREFLEERYGIELGQIKVVRCGVDLDEFRPCDRQNQGIPVILSVTWLRKIKGTEYLLKACQLLKEKGKSFRCLIVGGGEERRRLDEEVREMNLAKEVMFLGARPHEEVRRLYYEADLFVLPSLSEGIPVALMEAMASGLPVIATNITGIPELVTHGEDGLLVEPRNAVGLAHSIEYLLESVDVELRCAMGKRARQKVERSFNLKESVTRLEELFLKISEATEKQV
ncbi:MAG: glycosyltransferase family 4 protein [Candidatus Tectomicrobia bacterium]|nr:glycosyltransferase family 4 protein [Candidatus Tectomicrobia bacterium]